MPHFVITGPALESTTWSFPDVDVFVIGRASTCALVLPDPMRRVSQSHAAVVRFSSAEYFVRDLGSRDSIRVSGEKVYQRVLREGDRVDIADYRLLYRREATVRTALPRLRIVPSKDCDDGAGGETVSSRDMRTALRADAAGQEIVEQFVRLSDHGGSMASLFGEFMPRMLNYIDADRGFIARFTSPDAREYEEVTGFGLSPEEQIKIADETFVDRLLLSEVVQDRTTLLVPIASAEGVRGFFCMDRRTARVQPFSSEHTSLLLRIGELAAQCYESNPSSDHPPLSDDVKAWPLGLIGHSKPLNDLQN